MKLNTVAPHLTMEHPEVQEFLARVRADPGAKLVEIRRRMGLGAMKANRILIILTAAKLVEVKLHKESRRVVPVAPAHNSPRVDERPP